MVTTMLLLSIAAMASGANPHWHADACDTCHVGELPTPENPLLKTAPGDELCLGCHDTDNESVCRHQSTIPATSDMQGRMPESFQMALDDGQVVCRTCHDLPAQCLAERRSERSANPMFLRDGPFRQRSDSCYACHDEDAYKKLNPHDQLTEQGVPREAVCQLCHAAVDLTGAEDVDYLVFNIGDDLSEMCTGCHAVGPHPGAAFSFSTTKSSNHLVTPSIAMRRWMDKFALTSGYSLPLEPATGKIFCATCHNPHDRRLPDYPAIPDNAVKVSDTHYLRLENICIACHDK